MCALNSKSTTLQKTVFRSRLHLFYFVSLSSNLTLRSPRHIGTKNQGNHCISTAEEKFYTPCIIHRTAQPLGRTVFRQRLQLKRCEEHGQDSMDLLGGTLAGLAGGALAAALCILLPSANRDCFHSALLQVICFDLEQSTDIWAPGRGYSRTEFTFAKLLITVQDLV